VRGDACLSITCRKPEPPSEGGTANVAPAPDDSTKVWLAIQGSTNPADFRTFLETYPDSSLSPFARARLAALETPADAADPAIAPAPELSGTELIIAVQEELRRTGCYSGKADGKWGPRSQKGLANLLKRRSIVAPDGPDWEIHTGVCPAEAAPTRTAAVPKAPRTVAAPVAPEAEPTDAASPQITGADKARFSQGACKKALMDANGADPRIPICPD
jgi:hypothetical protein